MALMIEGGPNELGCELIQLQQKVSKLRLTNRWERHQATLQKPLYFK